MLRSLHIRDFVIVDTADIEFGPGFTVFSGETGAGKSILIDALALALGERTDVSVIREGASRADISAVFDPPPGLREWLAELGHEGDTLILRRVVDTGGRTRAFVNGVPATVAQLRELGERLLDIHGQHAHQSLLRGDAQRDLLDDHGGHHELRAAVRGAWHDWRRLTRQLAELERDAQGLASERERLQWEFEDLDRIGLAADEWPQLQAEHERLAHAQSLIDGVAQTLAQLDEADDSTHHQLAAAAQRVGQLAQHDAGLEGVAEALESARIALAEAVSDLNSYLGKLELDPARLAELDARIQAIMDAARKYRLAPEDIPARHAALHERLETLEQAHDLDGLRQRAGAAEQAYRKAAGKLRQARGKAATALGRAVTEAMQTLAMHGGRFEVGLIDAEPGPAGDQGVEFRVAGHAGTTPRPLAKVASGGELARISLALSVIASQAARVPTLIFDEVDTGVSGAVAEVVGRLLRSLGARHQVLCVTHLPQVAACANTQFQVAKSQAGGATRSHIARLDANGRIDEIARLLGGIEITHTTRRAAREMLSK
ncbi:DNA repair protein RecN [Verticiella sediminum]|uniref:DNA repair protein RecN n=1 Tax=Verticiella sediminum TaxID=1247510 RepID=A0A556AYL3_9BURK|nr:DNA repair protein RecN [Verticiella sediminum]TSH98034.1 DNA repair protein RecN [Verticiella sediminum]